jgi:hypothetical protein
MRLEEFAMADLTMIDLAKVTGRHVETLRRLARMNRLPGVYRLGCRWMITHERADRLRALPGAEEAGRMVAAVKRDSGQGDRLDTGNQETTR